MNNRLQQAGDNRYTHDKQGFRSIHSHRGEYTTYKYAPDYRLLEVHKEKDDIRYSYDHDDNGQRMTKYRNGELVEAYKWLDFVRLAGFYDGKNVYEFAYEEGSRLPFAMRRDDGSVAALFYDQVGSLRVVADTNGTVIKEILYDPFGSVIKDTNPSMIIPIGFAGGLHDRDIGFIRFGWRDYDPTTARWTAPDPMGDAGGDNDWYGYCLDDPVNKIDALGLAYSGNDFGPGYDGTSGSAYGPTSDGGWGYNDGSSVGGGTGEGSEGDVSFGGGRFGGGGATGSWGPASPQSPAAQPQKPEDVDNEEKPVDDVGPTFQKALEMDRKRKGALAREKEREDKERAEREARSMAYSRGMTYEDDGSGASRGPHVHYTQQTDMGKNKTRYDPRKSLISQGAKVVKY